MQRMAPWQGFTQYPPKSLKPALGTRAGFLSTPLSLLASCPWWGHPSSTCCSPPGSDMATISSPLLISLRSAPSPGHAGCITSSGTAAHHGLLPWSRKGMSLGLKARDQSLFLGTLPTHITLQARGPARWSHRGQSCLPGS